MRKIYINDVKITRELAKSFTWEDHLACEMVWSDLLVYSDDPKRFDATFEVGQALSIANHPYGSSQFEVYSVKAEFAPNCRLENDYYHHASMQMDVWITIKAFDEFYGFYVVGFYLSDVWSVCSTEKSYKECREHMLIRHYSEDH